MYIVKGHAKVQGYTLYLPFQNRKSKGDEINQKIQNSSFKIHSNIPNIPFVLELSDDYKLSMTTTKTIQLTREEYETIKQMLGRIADKCIGKDTLKPISSTSLLIENEDAN